MASRTTLAAVSAAWLVFASGAVGQQAGPVDVSDRVALEVATGQTYLDRQTRQLTSESVVTIRNISPQGLVNPLHLSVETTSAEVVVEGALGGHGLAPYGSFYIDLGAGIPGGRLDPGQATTTTVVFVRAATVDFTYTLTPFGVLNAPPVARAGGPYAGRPGEVVAFDGMGSSDPDGDPLTFTWTFGDGTSSTSAAPAYAYAQVGIFNARLRVEDPYGAADEADVPVTVVPAGEIALARSRVLNGVGQPLGGVTVEETAPSGAQTLGPTRSSGYVSLGGDPGAHHWVFRREGYLPVHRQATLGDETVAVLPNPWLTRKGPAGATFSPIQAGTILSPDGRVRVTYDPGAFAQFSPAYLTPLHGQALPGRLPPGWSPLLAFWLSFGDDPQVPGAGRLDLSGLLPAGAPAALARWDEGAAAWVVLELLTGSADATLPVTIPSPGVYAAVVPDAAPFTPPGAQVGLALEGTAASAPASSGFTASGAANPAVSPASPIASLVTATARVTFAHAEPLPSGMAFRCDIDETYDLQDGRVQKTPAYDTTVVAYQRPGDARADTLEASFPMRPLLLLGPQDLIEATVHVDVLTPSGFSGGVLNEGGGPVQGPGVAVAFAPGDLARLQAVEIRSLDTERFDRLTGDQGTVVKVFELNVGQVAPGRILAAAFGGLAPGQDFVLAQLQSEEGVFGLQPVERFRSDGSGVATSLEPAAGDRLPGLTGAGQYVLVAVSEALGLVTGTALGDAGGPQAGLQVTVAGQPWLSFSDETGGFSLLAPAGDVQLAVLDGFTGSAGSAAGVLTDPLANLRLGVSTVPTGPSIVAVEPVDGALDVPSVNPVQVTFSEPVDAASFQADGIRLLDELGSGVVGTLSLNLAATVGTFYPDSPLEPSTLYTIDVSPGITDAGGLPLTGATMFTFTTEALSVRSAGAQVVIYEPGSTNCPCIGAVPGYTPGDTSIVCVEGSQGTADADSPVVLINETSGETATVLSKADGSVLNFIRAAEEDYISVEFVNANRTRFRIPAGRQRFDNGAVGLYAGGGILEAESDGGPVQVIVEPGSINTRSILKLDFLTDEMIDQVVEGVYPQYATVLAGMNIQKRGGVMDGSIDLEFPIDPARITLEPGQEPEDAIFALAVPTKVNGVLTYMFLDDMRYEDGKIITNTKPFFEVALDEIAAVWAANRDNMQMQGIDPAGTVVLATGQTIVAVAGHVPDPVGSLMQIGLVVLQMQIAEKVRVSGKVVTCDVDHPGPCDPRAAGQVNANAQPLPGAVVTVRHATQSLSGANQGGLDLGAMFAISDRNGVYSLLIDNPALLNLTGYLDDDVGLTVASATHPRFFGLRPVEPVFSVRTSPFSKADLVFPFSSQQGVNSTPPFVSISTTPADPAPGETLELRVLATHGASIPTIALPVVDSVVSLAAGVDVLPADITVTGPVTDQTSPRRREATFTIESDLAARVLLKIEAGAANGETRSFRYPVTFGGTDINVTNDVVQVDFEDETGPTVVRTWPMRDARSWPPGAPIQVVFSEPVRKAMEQDPGAVTFSPTVNGTTWTISPDQTTLTIYPTRLAPETDYTVAINTAVKDLAGNPLQNSPFLLPFTTGPILEGTLSGLNQGGGLVIRGIYAYALDRGGGTHNALVVYDLSDPTSPVEVNRLPFAGWPRDLALIPNYHYVRKPGEPVQNQDLLAVVGGDVAPVFDEDANIVSAGQTLRVYGLADPVNPTILVAEKLTASVAATTKVVWEPPLLAYLESSADLQQIGLINLQSMIIGGHLTQEEFRDLPNDPTDGVDRNGDGDFVDADESLPLPASLPFEFAGKVGAVVLNDSTQRIRDFDLDTRVGHLSVALGAGFEKTLGGVVTSNPIAPGFRILLDTGTFLEPEDRIPSSFDISNGLPKRVHAVFGVELNDGGTNRLVNLALVSVITGADTGNEVVVLDITNALDIKPLSVLAIDSSLGLPQSVFQGADGLLRLATSQHAFLLDPSRLHLPADDPLNHPAIVGFLPNGGSGSFTQDDTLAGLSGVNLGGHNRILQRDPYLGFVSLDAIDPLVNPQDLVDDQAAIEDVVRALNVTRTLFPGRVRDASTNVVSSLDPADPRSHYYVLAIAPGSAGDTIDLSLESLNDYGYPLRNKGIGFAPVRAAAMSTVSDLGQDPRPDCDLPMRALPAYRLSSHKGSPYYNYYLSRPFVLVYEALSETEHTTLKDVPVREILWSGHYLRAGIDPSMDDNPILGPFAGRVDTAEKVLRPGTAALAQTFPGDYIVGPNPPPHRGFVELPGTFGTVAGHSAEFRTQTTDLVLPSRRLPITLMRFVGGQDLYDGPFGRGWDSPYHQRLVELQGGVFPPGSDLPIVLRGGNGDEIARTEDVLFYDGQGRVIVYSYAGDTPPPDYANDPLAMDLGWLDEADAFYLPVPGVFDMLVRFPNRTFARLTPEGTQLWYTPNGRLEKIYDKYPDNEIRFEYNERGELIKVDDVSVMADRYIEFGYYRNSADPLFNGFLDLTTTDPYIFGKVARVIDYTFREITYVYDECGRLVRKEGPDLTTHRLNGFLGTPIVEYRYAPGATANGICGVTAGSGTGTALFDSMQDVSKPEAPEVTMGMGVGPDIAVSLIHPNTAEDVATGSASATAALPGGLTATVKLNERGLPKEMTVDNGGGSQTRMQEHYPNGLPKKITYPEGNSMAFTYSGSTNLRSRANLESVTLDPGGRPGLPLTATYLYDERYNVPSGNGTDFNGTAVTFSLTPDHRDVESIQFGSDGSHSYSFNVYGQLESRTDAAGVVRGFHYNNVNGFLTTRTQGDLSTGWSYMGVDGSRGYPTMVIVPQGSPYEFVWNDVGKLIEVTRGFDLKEEFGYDQNGHLTQHEKQLGDGSPLRTTLEVLQNGFLDKVTVHAVETDGFNQDLVYDYEPDALFRTVSVIHPGGETQAFEDFTADGFPRKMTLGEYVEEYTYDGNGNLLTATGNGGGMNTYTYDGHDRLITLTSPSGELFERSYFGNNALKSFKVTDQYGNVNEDSSYTVDALGRVKTHTGVGDKATYSETYTYSGSTVTRTVTGGDAYTYTYTEAGLAQGMSHSLQDVTYTYDGSVIDSILSMEGSVTYSQTLTPVNDLGQSEGWADDVGLIASYERRNDGAMISLTDASGQVTELPKSRLGEALGLERPEGIDLTFEYDATRQLSAITDRANKGRSTSYNDSQFKDIVHFRDGNQSTFSYENGAVSDISIPGGSLRIHPG